VPDIIGFSGVAPSAVSFASRLPDRYAGLAAIEAPRLIVHGTEDELIPFSEATFLDAGIANSTLVAKDGQDHFTVVCFEFAENLRAAASRLSETPAVSARTRTTPTRATRGSDRGLRRRRAG
jgi:pimeloyl-ACP methyl ester carboxylesterase